MRSLPVAVADDGHDGALRDGLGDRLMGLLVSVIDRPLLRNALRIRGNPAEGVTVDMDLETRLITGSPVDAFSQRGLVGDRRHVKPRGVAVEPDVSQRQATLKRTEP